MVGRYVAGAARLPFYPLRSYAGSDLPAANPLIRSVASPYDPEDTVAVVPPLNPDVTIIHAQRADADGNTQVWGLVGVQREAALAASGWSSSSRNWSTVRSSAPTRTGLCSPEWPWMPCASSRSGRIPRSHRGTTTATTRSTASGTPSAGTRAAPRVARTSGSTASRIGHPISPSSIRTHGRDSAPDRDRRDRSITATTDDHFHARRGDDRIRRGGAARSADRLRGHRSAEAAANLARRTVAPDLELIYESGVIGPDRFACPTASAIQPSSRGRPPP